MEAIPEATGEPVLVQAGDFATFLDGFPATGTLTKGSISTGTFTRVFLMWHWYSGALSVSSSELGLVASSTALLYLFSFQGI